MLSMSSLLTREADELAGAVIGSSAPDFVLKTDQGDDWRLSDHSGGVIVLLFYPQNETLICTRQLCSVRDNWEHYLDTRATIVGISPSTAEEHRAFSSSRMLPFQLLADPDREVTRQFGKHWLFPINLTRAVVIIDAKRIIRNRDVMLRAFRPSDERRITDIYSARGDELKDTYADLKTRISNVIAK